MSVAKALPVGLACCFAGLLSISKAFRATVELDSDKAKPASEAVFPCKRFPERVVECSGTHKPKFLAHGSFGEAWLAKDVQSQQQVVIKLLYTDESQKHYLTREHVLHDAGRVASEQAKRECEVGMAAMAERGKLPEAQRVCGCYGHNIHSHGAPGEVLYLKMEVAGSKTLGLYAYEHFKDPTFGGAQVAKIFKMILEAFKAMHEIQWVMHDFHSGNVMVQEHKGELLLQLIDFGSSVKGTEDGACDSKSEGHFCNSDYAPPEYFSNVLEVEAECERPAFDPKHPSAFDMYGVGVLLFEHVVQRQGNVHRTFEGFFRQVGTYLGADVPDWRAPAHLWYGLREQVVSMYIDLIFAGEKELTDFDESIPWANEFYRGLSKVSKDFKKMPHAEGFLRECAKLLAIDPGDRPSAAELLEHPFMKATEVPNEERRPPVSRPLHVNVMPELDAADSTDA